MRTWSGLPVAGKLGVTVSRSRWIFGVRPITLLIQFNELGWARSRRQLRSVQRGLVTVDEKDPLFVEYADLDDLAIVRYGRKAVRLAQAAAVGLRVPDGVVCQIGTLRRHIESSGIDSVTESIGERLPGDSYAVRSSEHAEDGRESSFAGISRSFLNVRRRALAEILMEIVNANGRSTGGAYATRVGAQVALECHAGVLIQTMIESPRAGGVAFFEHPMRAGFGLVESAVGLPAAVTSGQVSPDRYTLEWSTRDLDVVIGRQRKAAVSLPAGGVGYVPMGTRRVQPSLSEREAASLFEIILTLSARFEYPQDVEWALDSSGFIVLQSRDISRLRSRLGS